MEDDDTLFDQKLKNDDVSLVIGAPGTFTLKRVVEIFEKSSIHRAQHAALDSASGNGAIFEYGPRAGYKPFLEVLTEFLTEEYQSPVERMDLLLTPGATVGLWLAATALLPPGKGIVFMECPSYFIALSIVEKDLGHKPVAVSMAKDGTGVDTDELEKVMAREYAQRSEVPEGKFWAMYYTIPTFHNPTGVVFSPERSKKVIQLARKYDVLVFCDDVYNLLHYGEGSQSPKRLYAYDDKSDPDYKGNVISNGSFSKILGPGFRIGWIECCREIRDCLKDTGIIDSGGSMNNVMAGVVASAITLGYQKKHLEFLRKEYFNRIDTIFEVFEKELPQGFSSVKPKGGYFIWVDGPSSWNSDEFVQFCQSKYHVGVLPSVRCGKLETGPITNALRISFAFYQCDQLRSGITKFCTALKEYLIEHPVK